MNSLEPLEISGLLIDPTILLPGGIVTTLPETVVCYANHMPVGAVNAKTTTLDNRLGNPAPIFAQISKSKFQNAVGYANMGLEETIKEYSEVGETKKPIIGGITAENANDFQKLAEAFNEINCFKAIEAVLSCPHTAGFGVEAGLSEANKTKEITEAIRSVTDKPLIIKLAPEIEIVGQLAFAAYEGGADAISAVNTATPEEYKLPSGEGYLLYNIKGGLSGKVLLPLGVESVREIRKTIPRRIPVIGIGGIETAKDARFYLNAGADGIEIGTGVRDMSSFDLSMYLTRLMYDLKEGTNQAEAHISKKVVRYTLYKINKVTTLDDDLKVFEFEGEIKSEPGQYVMAAIVGDIDGVKRTQEIPLTIAKSKPLTLGVRKVGCATKVMHQYKEGQIIDIRGPYGNSFTLPKEDQSAYLFSPGTGAIPMLAQAHTIKENNSDIDTTIFLAAKTAKQLMFLDEFKDLGHLVICTDDGSKGHKGFITNVAKETLAETKPENTKFYICAPEIIGRELIEIASEYSPPENIEVSVERYTACARGICGKCAFTINVLGELMAHRTCVDGHIYPAKALVGESAYGRYKRDSSGKRVEIK